MPKNIAIVVTNQDKYENADRPTGLWLSELVHFWDVLEKEGYSFDIISPKGGAIPLEPKSLEGGAFDKASRRRYDDDHFMKNLEDSAAASSVSWREFDAVYYTGGHGVMYDFLDDEGLQKLNRDLYENGRVVSAVCHGYCGIINTLLSDGQYMIKGKNITGFTWVEEKLAGVAGIVPYNAEALAKKRGCHFKKSLIPFRPKVVVDDTIVTGQNPFSATLTAQKTLEVLR